MNADEMLEKLGFHKKIKDSWIVYENDKFHSLYFYLNHKNYACYGHGFDISPDLHLAIHTKMKELGWIE